MPGQEFELREQDRWLPIANVARLMKNTLPSTAKVSKDAKECMQECVSEFISFVTSEASDRCLMEKRKTINGEDILYSLHTLGFENYAEVLKIYLAKYRQQQVLKQERGEIRTKKKKKPTENGTDNGNNIENIEISNLNPNIIESRELFQHPMDESIAVLREQVEKTTGGQDIDLKKPDYEQEYVSQLYEQSYADVPLHMSNPDYHGGGASEGILLKKQLKDNNHMNDEIMQIKTEDNDDVNLRVPGLDLEVGVGVNVHLGNTESLDEINMRLNKKTDNEAAINKSSNMNNNDNNNNSSTSNSTNTQENMQSNSASTGNDSSTKEGHGSESNELTENLLPSKTPATTRSSELLLLNDNITGISEREEIVGLTNGHSGMYSFE